MFFIANPEAKSEDDGVLVSITFDGEKEQSYFVVIDAITFTEIDRAYLPHNIPWSAHGMHFPEAKWTLNGWTFCNTISVYYESHFHKTLIILSLFFCQFTLSSLIIRFKLLTNMILQKVGSWVAFSTSFTFVFNFLVNCSLVALQRFEFGKGFVTLVAC